MEVIDEMIDELKELEELQTRFEQEKDVNHVLICAIEEMSEATKVMTKFLRFSHKFNKEYLTEEIAHTLLMLDVVRNIFGLPDADIKAYQIQALWASFNISEDKNA